MAEQSIRVFLCDDHAIVRQGIRALLTTEPGLEVVGEAADGEEGIHAALDLRPDVVLMDVQMPGIDGLEATRRIMEQETPPRVLVMSTHESGSYEEPALAAGAIAFIPKSEFSMDALEESWAAATAGEA